MNTMNTMNTTITTDNTGMPVAWYEMPPGYDGPPLYYDAGYVARAEAEAKERQREWGARVAARRAEAEQQAAALVAAEAARRAMGPRMVTVACVECGEPFQRRADRHGRTCSEPCAKAMRSKALAIGNKTRAANRKNPETVTLICPECGGEFTKAWKDRNQSATCGPACGHTRQARKARERAAARKAGRP